MKFSSGTNQGGQNNYFNCSTLVIFPGSDSSKCLWTSNDVLVAELSSSYYYSTYNFTVTVKDHNIKTLCPTTNSMLCGYVSNATVNVLLPSIQNSPLVSLSAARLISTCDNIVLDATKSIGPSNLNWKSILWTVTGPSNVSDISTLLNHINTTHIPITIPNKYLSQGIYTFTLQLENLFLKSSVAVTSVQVKANTGLLNVRITGSSIVTILRSQALSLFANTSSSICGARITDSLTYAWSIYKGSSSSVINLKSQSLDQRYFNLQSNTLDISSSYTIQVTVTSINSGTSTSSVIVYVGLSGLVASIRGGSQQSLSFGGNTKLLIGSDSYSLDYSSSMDKLSYYWTCQSLTASDYGNSCDMMFTNQNSSVVGFIADNPITIGQSYQVSLYVYDIYGQSSSTTVTLTVILSGAPIIVMNPVSTIYNPNSRIILTAQITCLSSCSTSWTSNSISDLESIVTTPIVHNSLTSYINIIQLAITPSSLIGGLSYTFRLSASYLNSNTSVTSFSSVIINLNQPPSGGRLSVTPKYGYAVYTTFFLQTNSWYDVATDYPITFELKYYTFSSSDTISVKARDGITFVYSILGQGLEYMNYSLTCVAVAYDVLNSSSTVSTLVNVYPFTNITELYEISNVSLTLAFKIGDTNSIIQTIGSVISTLNTVNCSKANPVFCASINRTSCNTIAETCGPCLSNYVGISGSSNLPCQLENSIKAISASCIIDSQCITNSCVNGICVYQNQNCPNDCTSIHQGTCIYRDISTLSTLTSCSQGNLSCQAVCNCTQDYYGNDCSLTLTEYQISTTIRSLFCQSMVQLTSIQDVTVDVVQSRASQLTNILSDPTQLDNNAFTNCAMALLSTMQAYTSLSSSCSTSSVVAVGKSISAILSKGSAITDSLHQLISTQLGTVGQWLQTCEIIGEVQYITEQYLRLASSLNSRSSHIELFLPRTDFERINNIPLSTISLNASTSSISDTMVLGLNIFDMIGLQISSEDSRGIGRQTTLYELYEYSDQLLVKANSSTIVSTSDELVLINKRPISYSALTSNTSSYTCKYGNPYNFTTNCTTSNIQLHCPGDSLIVFNYVCSNPKLVSQCQYFTGYDYSVTSNCYVKSYNEINTTCMCSNTWHNQYQRRLDLRNDASSTLIELSSKSVKLTETSSINYYKTLILEVIRRNLIITMSMCVLLATLFLGLFHYVMVDIREEKEKKQNFLKESNATKMKKLFQWILPPEFSDEAWYIRFYRKLTVEHEWLCVLMPYDPTRDYRSVKWVQGCGRAMHIIFIATILARSYFADNGVCLNFDTETKCLKEKSFGSFDNLCAWDTSTFTCSFNSNISIINTVFLIGCICLLCIPLDNLFDFMLCKVKNLVVVSLKNNSIDLSDENIEQINQKLNETIDHELVRKSSKSIRSTILRAARVQKLRDKMDSVTPIIEAARLVSDLFGYDEQNFESSLKRSRVSSIQNYLMEFYNWLLHDDLSHTQYLLKHEDAIHSKIIVSKKVIAARSVADCIRTKTELIQNEFSKEIFLLRTFLISSVSGLKQRLAYRYLLYDIEQSIYQQNKDQSIEFYCFAILPLYVFAIAFYIFYFGVSIGIYGTAIWLIVVISAIIIDLIISQPAKVWMKWIVITSFIDDIRIIRDVLRDKAKLVLNRTRGSLREGESLIQHLNPACRVARSIPHLPSSKLLVSLTDHDMLIHDEVQSTSGTKEKKTMITIMEITRIIMTWYKCILSTFMLVFKVILSVITLFPYPIQDCIFESIIISILFGIMFGVISYSNQYIYIIAICALTFLTLLIREYMKSRERMKKKMLKNNIDSKGSSSSEVRNTTLLLKNRNNSNHNDDSDESILYEEKHIEDSLKMKSRKQSIRFLSILGRKKSSVYHMSSEYEDNIDMNQSLDASMTEKVTMNEEEGNNINSKEFIQPYVLGYKKGTKLNLSMKKNRINRFNPFQKHKTYMHDGAKNILESKISLKELNLLQPLEEDLALFDDSFQSLQDFYSLQQSKSGDSMSSQSVDLSLSGGNMNMSPLKGSMKGLLNNLVNNSTKNSIKDSMNRNSSFSTIQNKYSMTECNDIDIDDDDNDDKNLSTLDTYSFEYASTPKNLSYGINFSDSIVVDNSLIHSVRDDAIVLPSNSTPKLLDKFKNWFGDITLSRQNSDLSAAQVSNSANRSLNHSISASPNRNTSPRYKSSSFRKSPTQSSKERMIDLSLDNTNSQKLRKESSTNERSIKTQNSLLSMISIALSRSNTFYTNDDLRYVNDSVNINASPNANSNANANTDLTNLSDNDLNMKPGMNNSNHSHDDRTLSESDDDSDYDSNKDRNNMDKDHSKDNDKEESIDDNEEIYEYETNPMQIILQSVPNNRPNSAKPLTSRIESSTFTQKPNKNSQKNTPRDSDDLYQNMSVYKEKEEEKNILPSPKNFHLSIDMSFPPPSQPEMLSSEKRRQSNMEGSTEEMSVIRLAILNPIVNTSALEYKRKHLYRRGSVRDTRPDTSDSTTDINSSLRATMSKSIPKISKHYSMSHISKDSHGLFDGRPFDVKEYEKEADRRIKKFIDTDETSELIKQSHESISYQSNPLVRAMAVNASVLTSNDLAVSIHRRRSFLEPGSLLLNQPDDSIDPNSASEDKQFQNMTMDSIYMKEKQEVSAVKRRDTYSVDTKSFGSMNVPSPMNQPFAINIRSKSEHPQRIKHRCNIETHELHPIERRRKTFDYSPTHASTSSEAWTSSKNVMRPLQSPSLEQLEHEAQINISKFLESSQDLYELPCQLSSQSLLGDLNPTVTNDILNISKMEPSRTSAMENTTESQQLQPIQALRKRSVSSHATLELQIAPYMNAIKNRNILRSVSHSIGETIVSKDNEEKEDSGSSSENESDSKIQDKRKSLLGNLPPLKRVPRRMSSIRIIPDFKRSDSELSSSDVETTSRRRFSRKFSQPKVYALESNNIMKRMIDDRSLDLIALEREAQKNVTDYLSHDAIVNDVIKVPDELLKRAQTAILTKQNSLQAHGVLLNRKGSAFERSFYGESTLLKPSEDNLDSLHSGSTVSDVDISNNVTQGKRRQSWIDPMMFDTPINVSISISEDKDHDKEKEKKENSNTTDSDLFLQQQSVDHKKDKTTLSSELLESTYSSWATRRLSIPVEKIEPTANDSSHDSLSTHINSATSRKLKPYTNNIKKFSSSHNLNQNPSYRKFTRSSSIVKSDLSSSLEFTHDLVSSNDEEDEDHNQSRHQLQHQAKLRSSQTILNPIEINDKFSLLSRHSIQSFPSQLSDTEEEIVSPVKSDYSLSPIRLTHKTMKIDRKLSTSNDNSDIMNDMKKYEKEAQKTIVEYISKDSVVRSTSIDSIINHSVTRKSSVVIKPMEDIFYDVVIDEEEQEKEQQNQKQKQPLEFKTSLLYDTKDEIIDDNTMNIKSPIAKKEKAIVPSESTLLQAHEKNMNVSPIHSISKKYSVHRFNPNNLTKESITLQPLLSIDLQSRVIDEKETIVDKDNDKHIEERILVPKLSVVDVSSITTSLENPTKSVVVNTISEIDDDYDNHNHVDDEMISPKMTKSMIKYYTSLSPNRQSRKLISKTYIKSTSISEDNTTNSLLVSVPSIPFDLQQYERDAQSSISDFISNDTVTMPASIYNIVDKSTVTNPISHTTISSDYDSFGISMVADAFENISFVSGADESGEHANIICEDSILEPKDHISDNTLGSRATTPVILTSIALQKSILSPLNSPFHAPVRSTIKNQSSTTLNSIDNSSEAKVSDETILSSEILIHPMSSLINKSTEPLQQVSPSGSSLHSPIQQITSISSKSLRSPIKSFSRNVDKISTKNSFSLGSSISEDSQPIKTNSRDKEIVDKDWIRNKPKTLKYRKSNKPKGIDFTGSLASSALSASSHIDMDTMIQEDPIVSILATEPMQVERKIDSTSMAISISMVPPRPIEKEDSMDEIVEDRFNMATEAAIWEENKPKKITFRKGYKSVKKPKPTADSSNSHTNGDKDYDEDVYENEKEKDQSLVDSQINDELTMFLKGILPRR